MGLNNLRVISNNMTGVTLGDKVIDWKDAGRWLNYSEKVEDYKDLIDKGKDLVNQGMTYDGETSWEVSSNSLVFVFKGSSGPDIGLELPVKYKPHSRMYRWHKEKIMKRVDSYFLKNSDN